MPTGTLTADATFVAGRVRHHRQRDHFGADSDLAVVLSERIGPYEEQTPIHWVLVDLVARFDRLETADIVFGTLSVDAAISRRAITVDAVIMVEQIYVLTVDADIYRGGRITVDAVIQGGGRVTADAIIVY